MTVKQPSLNIIVYRCEEDDATGFVAVTSHPHFLISGDGDTPSAAVRELAKALALADNDLQEAIFNGDKN